MKRLTFLPILVAVFLGLFCLPLNGKAIPYTFTKIADNSDLLNQISQNPSINNNGAVAFEATLDTGHKGIWAGSGGGLDTIVDTSGLFESIGGCSINDNGTVAFYAYLDAGGKGIYTSDGTTVTTIADNSTLPSDFTGFSSTLSINNKGTVSFVTALGAGAENYIIFGGSGGPLTPIADTRGVFKDLANPSINDKETVAFWASLDSGGNGFFAGSGGPIATLYDTSGLFSRLQSGPSLNNDETIAFVANFPTIPGGEGVFAGDGGPTTTIADNSGSYLNFGDVSINNRRQVAFQAIFDPGSKGGIFTGADPVADKIIAEGDTLYGLTVMQVGFSHEGLNDAGQIAFWAKLADGSEGIYRAEPIPEPSTIVLMSCGLLGLLGICVKRRRKVK